MALTMTSKHIMLVLLFVLLCAIQNGMCRQDYFNAVPKELRCSGCELTVKVLNQMLEETKPKEAEKLVDFAMKIVCDKKRFSISEYNADSMVKTCEFMKDFHSDELRKELIKHYTKPKPKRSSYIELSQRICLNIMRLCPGMAHMVPDHAEEDMEALKHFLDSSGKEARIPKPVPSPASRDEL